MSEDFNPPPKINRLLTMKETTNTSPLNGDKEKILALGYLLLRLEQLHKLGLKALQLVSLVYHISEIILQDPGGSEQNTALADYCATEGVECISATHSVMLLMQACVEEIRDFYKINRAPASGEIVDATAKTSEFISHISHILDATINNVSNLLIAPPKLSGKSDHPIDRKLNKSLAFSAVTKGRESLRELQEDVAEFNAISSDVVAWVEKSTVTMHAGGYLKIYYPPDS